MMSRSFALVLLASLLATGVARADEDDVDVTTLYELSTDGTTKQLTPGEKGTFVFSVKTVDGAYISDEAPLRLKLSGKNLTPAKDQITYADSLTKKEGQKPPPDPTFEIPFTAGEKGAGQVDVKATLFICTARLCVRQQRDLSVPVQVN